MAISASYGACGTPTKQPFGTSTEKTKGVQICVGAGGQTALSTQLKLTSVHDDTVPVQSHTR